MSPTKSTVNYTQMCYICSTKYDKNQSCYWPSICVLIEHMLRLFPASPALRKGDLRICGNSFPSNLLCGNWIIKCLRRPFSIIEGIWILDEPEFPSHYFMVYKL